MKLEYLISRSLMTLSAMLFGYSVGKNLDTSFQLIFFIFFILSSISESIIREKDLEET